MGLVSVDGSMGADLVCGTGVDELAAPVVVELCGGGTEASVAEGIVRLEECGLVECTLVGYDGLVDYSLVVYTSVACRREPCMLVEVHYRLVVHGMLAQGREELELDDARQDVPNMELWLL